MWRINSLTTGPTNSIIPGTFLLLISLFIKRIPMFEMGQRNWHIQMYYIYGWCFLDGYSLTWNNVAVSYKYQTNGNCSIGNEGYSHIQQFHEMNYFNHFLATHEWRLKVTNFLSWMPNRLIRTYLQESFVCRLQSLPELRNVLNMKTTLPKWITVRPSPLVYRIFFCGWPAPF